MATHAIILANNHLRHLVYSSLLQNKVNVLTTLACHFFADPTHSLLQFLEVYLGFLFPFCFLFPSPSRTSTYILLHDPSDSYQLWIRATSIFCYPIAKYSPTYLLLNIY